MPRPAPRRAAGSPIRRHAHPSEGHPAEGRPSDHRPCGTRPSARLAAVVAAVLVLTAAGCSRDGGASAPVPVAEPSATGTATGTATGPATGSATGSATGTGTAAAAGATDPGSLPAGWSLVATAREAQVRVLAAPGGEERVTLGNPTSGGGPLTFRVLERSGEWLRVQLPVRPDGSTGWVAVAGVGLSATPYRLVVHRSAHRLDLYEDARPVATYPVGVGTSVTPTPAGTYYLTDLIRTRHPEGTYGPYAFGLSAFSPTLTSFAGGPGQLGLHGTNEPGRVGTDVSHGCLRVRNEVITDLAHRLPLGTPVEILA